MNPGDPDMKNALSILCLLLVCGAASAKDLRSARPEQHGFSPERLERINHHMERAVDNETMVGGLGVIARNGRIIFEETWGQADRENNVPMAHDTIFRIYSMSKPITSVALMTLYEEGRFELDDPVADYIPELADLEVALSTADSRSGVVSDGTISRGMGSGDDTLEGQTRKPRRQPTIHDLLRHTAGFTYGSFGNTEVDKLYREAGYPMFDGDLADFVAKLGELPLQYEPGTRWHYSVAVAVQGRLIEVLTGMPFGDFLQQRLFEPLGMKDTGFVVPAAKLGRFAQLYAPEGVSPTGFGEQPTGDGLEVAAAYLSRGYIEGQKLQSGGIGLTSTAGDYLRFAQMLLSGGELDGVRILSPRTVDYMTMNHLGDVPMGLGRDGSGFGLGFAVVLNPANEGAIGSAGEYTWGGAAGTSFWVDPAENLIGIFMVQSLPHRTRLKDEFKQLTYGAMSESYQ